MEKNASTVKETPAPAIVENSVLVKLDPEPQKPPKPELKEAIPLEISYAQLMRYDWTMWFCRTKYQHALARLFKKANYKLHKELDICTIIRKQRETYHLVNSFATSRVFDPDSLRNDYQEYHWANNI